MPGDDVVAAGGEQDPVERDGNDTEAGANGKVARRWKQGWVRFCPVSFASRNG